MEDGVMICQNCGKEIPNDSLFCPECGTKCEKQKQVSEKRVKVKQSPRKEAQTKKKNKIIGIVAAIFVAVCIVVCVVVVLLSVLIKPTINLNEYVTISTEGYDNFGKAVMEFDLDKFEKDYEKKISEARKFIYYVVDGEFDKADNLSNGDVITYKWDCDDDYALEIYRVKLKYSDIKYKVKNLEEAVLDTQEKADTTATDLKETEAPTEANISTKPASQIQYTGMEGTIQELLNQNFEFISYYQVGMLNYGSYDNNLKLYVVDDSRVSTWGDFKQIVYSIYSSKRAKEIIETDNKYWGPYGDSANLYIYPANFSTKSYSVTWDNYTIEINSQSSSVCYFTVTDVNTGYSTTGSVVQESSGKWLLESEVY